MGCEKVQIQIKSIIKCPSDNGSKSKGETQMSHNVSVNIAMNERIHE
jgi:hypothetical protein